MKQCKENFLRLISCFDHHRAPHPCCFSPLSFNRTSADTSVSSAPVSMLTKPIGTHGLGEGWRGVCGDTNNDGGTGWRSEGELHNNQPDDEEDKDENKNEDKNKEEDEAGQQRQH